MASTISRTEERIAYLHNNAVVPNDDQDGVQLYLINTSLKQQILCFIFIPNNKVNQKNIETNDEDEEKDCNDRMDESSELEKLKDDESSGII